MRPNRSEDIPTFSGLAAGNLSPCCMQPAVEEWLDAQGLLEIMNVTPTESEAWDIVQMEEIEREFLDEEGAE